MNIAKRQNSIKARREQNYHWSDRSPAAWNTFQALIALQLYEASRERDRTAKYKAQP